MQISPTDKPFDHKILLYVDKSEHVGKVVIIPNVAFSDHEDSQSVFLTTYRTTRVESKIIFVKSKCNRMYFRTPYFSDCSNSALIHPTYHKKATSQRCAGIHNDFRNRLH